MLSEYVCPLDCSKDNLRIVLPITVGTHGVRADDDPAEDPGLRPLYHRVSAGGESPVMLTVDDDGDEMGEIDHSLFETSAPRPSKLI